MPQSLLCCMQYKVMLDIVMMAVAAFTKTHWHGGFGQHKMLCMMASSNANIFRVTGHLCREFTGEFPTQRPVTWSFDVFLCSVPRINGWVNNGEAGDLRRHSTHYDVIIMDWRLPTVNSMMMLGFFPQMDSVHSGVFMKTGSGPYLYFITVWLHDSMVNIPKTPTGNHETHPLW